LNHSEAVQLTGCLYEDVANTNGVKLWDAGDRLNGDGVTGLQCKPSGGGAPISIVQAQRAGDKDGCIDIELFAVAGTMSLKDAASKARSAMEMGFDACQRQHVQAYRGEVDSALVEFDGNPATLQGFNFGQMHMHMAFSPIAEKTGVPIKGLTGHGYRFLNFWDMDFHMFPYYLMTKPGKTRKLLEYRYSQLPRYRENAIKWGAKGAQVPWETSTRGCEETAPWLCLQEREIHISADAAYMFKRYADITGDESVMTAMGAEFGIETARFYASRLKWNEERGLYDLPDIGCPDQYHTFADNNVFISMWAQWNLGHAADVFESGKYSDAVEKTGASAQEAAEWRNMAEKLFILAPNEDGIIEEFEGFFKLDENLDGICETYCSHSQAVKQPDVLAAFIPFEERYPRDIRIKNWHYYNARTLHGSSLSLPGMAHAAARCGLNDEALFNLHQSCRMDLDDVNLDTERGVHVSGGALEWATIVCGFGGLEAGADGLTIRPNLPRQWTRLKFRVWWHFQPVTVAISCDKVTVEIGREVDCAVPVRIGEGGWQNIEAGGRIEERHAANGRR